MRPGTAETMFSMGVVIGVDYPRVGHHGCEERIKVLWSHPLWFSEVCDCELLRAADFLD
jgi:alkyl hydroperoxide reductase subunit AhpC